MKPTLLLLHGALGSASQLQPLVDLLKESASVYTLNFAGHGGSPLQTEKFSLPHFADQVQEFVATLGSGQVHVFGYSMGGYAALLAAAEAPARFASITTLGTKFDWSPESAAVATKFLDPVKMAEKVPAFTAQLAQLHTPTPWQEVVAATVSMMQGLGELPPLTATELGSIKTPVQVLVGEADQTAGADASAEFAALMPKATFEVIKDTPHPLEKVDLNLLASKILAFVAQHPAK